MKTSTLAFCFAALLLDPPAMPADDAPAPPSTTSGAGHAMTQDEQSIRNSAKLWQAAFNAKIAKDIVAQLAPDGEIVTADGDVVRGRAENEARLTEMFANRPNAKMAVKVESVRFPAPGIAIEDGTSSIVAAPGQPPEVSRYTAVHVKLDGQWRVASVRDLTPDAEAVPPAERLKPLEWLIGEWVSESDEADVAFTFRWGRDRKYIVQDFVVKRAGREAMHGTQRIGWDPLRKTIKSWMFDSIGGNGEGIWTWVGDRWVIKIVGVRSDGTTGSATNVLMPLNKSGYTWESKDRIVGDEISPDMVVKIVRKAPRPQEVSAGAKSSSKPAASGERGN